MVANVSISIGCTTRLNVVAIGGELNVLPGDDLADGSIRRDRAGSSPAELRACFLRTGQYIDAGGVTHNKLFNTIINAVGIRNQDGSYYDSFGDPSLERGVIAELIRS